MQPHKDMALTEPDTADIAALYQKCALAIFAYLVRHTQSEEDAEDILVEVFLAALENKQFLLLPEKVQLAWLWRVARNKAVDTYRRSVRRRSVTLETIMERIMDNDDLDPEHFALQQEEYDNLQAHLKSLSPLQQEVLRLRFRQDLRCSDIAVRLGKSEGAIKVMLSRTLNLLRNIYKVEGEE